MELCFLACKYMGINQNNYDLIFLRDLFTHSDSTNYDKTNVFLFHYLLLILFFNNVLYIHKNVNFNPSNV